MKKSTKIIIAIFACLALTLSLALTISSLQYYPRYIKESKPFDVTQTPIIDGEISAMSSNIRYFNFFDDRGEKNWFYRANLLVDVVEKHAPDVIGYQEVTKLQYNYLEKNLSGYGSFNAYRDKLPFKSESCPVFYRADKYDLVDQGVFWLSQTPEIMSKGWDAYCNRICVYVVLSEKSSGKSFVFFNTHLDHVSEEARIKGMELIVDKAKGMGDIPMILLGDMNATEQSETYAAATEMLLDAAEGYASSTTYQAWGERPDSPRIDYIMLSKAGLSVKKYWVENELYDGVYVSDHFPVFAILQLDAS